MATGPQCQDGDNSRGSQVWAEVWRLQDDLGLSDGDMLLLFNLLPPCHWRAAELLKALRDLQNVRAMMAEQNSK